MKNPFAFMKKCIIYKMNVGYAPEIGWRKTLNFYIRDIVLTEIEV